MGLATGLATYFVIWWITLFCVLPLWVRPPAEPEEGHAPSAPENPHLFRKFAINTGLSLVVFLLVFAAIELNLIDFRQWAAELPLDLRPDE